MIEHSTAHRLKRGSQATSRNSRSVPRPSPPPLLGPGSVDLSNGAKHAMASVLAHGAGVCLASGRPALSMSGVAKQLFDDPTGLPCVCFNGALAVVMDSEGLPSRTLFEQRLPSTVSQHATKCHLTSPFAGGCESPGALSGPHSNHSNHAVG